MPKPRISAQAGSQCVRAALSGDTTRQTVATAARYLLQSLSDRDPGNTCEVRVPPYGAVQCIAGPSHTRGTPPNVVEMDAATLLELASGALTWAAALAEARVNASGARADLSHLLPLL